MASLNGTFTPVASSATQVTLLEADALRTGYSVYNTGSGTLYLMNAADTVTSSNYSIQIASGGYYEGPFNYGGKVVGLWSAANGFANVTSFR